jgi:dipeptidase E
MRHLLLISNSTLHGSGYLEHCADELRDFLGSRKTVLFVPYALHDWDGYAKAAEDGYAKLGHALESVHRATDPVAAVGEADAIFIGGGNTFRLLNRLYEKKLLRPIRERVDGGAPYVGTSAGSNVACVTIQTTNDMPIVQPPSFDALNLVPFNINPHYLDPDPDSKHMGETRAQRIQEFHEMNDRSVVGLREGAMLRVEGEVLTLEGSTGARLFRKGEKPQEYQPGADMSFLLRDPA